MRSDRAPQPSPGDHVPQRAVGGGGRPDRPDRRAQDDDRRHRSGEED